MMSQSNEASSGSHAVHGRLYHDARHLDFAAFAYRAARRTPAAQVEPPFPCSASPGSHVVHLLVLLVPMRCMGTLIHDAGHLDSGGFAHRIARRTPAAQVEPPFPCSAWEREERGMMCTTQPRQPPDSASCIRATVAGHLSFCGCILDGASRNPKPSLQAWRHLLVPMRCMGTLIHDAGHLDSGGFAYRATRRTPAAQVEPPFPCSAWERVE